uniref:Uncharacterized protein n=1 Tax=Arundo donax TaxID=35708 RepID=A0A0A9ATR9_ARUDO
MPSEAPIYSGLKDTYNTYN